MPYADSSDLLVAVGKTAGALLTCTVTPTKASATDAATRFQYSHKHIARGAHSSRLVTGVAWGSTNLPLQALSSQADAVHTQPAQHQAKAAMQAANPASQLRGGEQVRSSQLPDTVMHDAAQEDESHTQQEICGQPSGHDCASASQAAADLKTECVYPLLVSSGADGQIRSWQHSAEGLLQRPCPVAWSSPSLEKDKAFQPMGVAVSGNGLVLAVAVDNGTAASAVVQ